ncbi:hypothetical protein VTN49DRAFT_1091 [Thermomyces lanuginosus]|uniref:uncharacterized protein n=1 Tax=Thermomyces lanuginosus TaxID=5541 RepID=UPI003744488C
MRSALFRTTILRPTLPVTQGRSISTAPQRLADQTCMITGGSSGIGYAIAERFLAEGAKGIILVGRSKPRLIEAKTRLEQRLSPERSTTISILPGDVSKLSEENSRRDDNDNERKGWLKDLEKEMEKVSILVNAAGLSVSKVLIRTSPADISAMLRTNLEGAIMTSRALLKACLRTAVNRDTSAPRSRCVINISSLLALRGDTGTVTYAASKAGLIGMTRSVAVEAAELLRGKGMVLRSNVIVPGYVDTPFIEDFSEERVSQLKERIPLGRFATPAEVADAALFLATNEYANNCVLNLDGGLSAT